ncbi:cytochrome P450 [Aspergillus spectabilis]
MSMVCELKRDHPLKTWVPDEFGTSWQLRYYGAAASASLCDLVVNHLQRTFAKSVRFRPVIYVYLSDERDTRKERTRNNILGSLVKQLILFDDSVSVPDKLRDAPMNRLPRESTMKEAFQDLLMAYERAYLIVDGPQQDLPVAPPAPVAAPHVSNADLMWNGYLIRKGSYLVANIGSFTHDPTIYKQPMRFKPEQFLAEENHTSEVDPAKYVFRVWLSRMPGRFLADDRLFLFIAQSLASFNTSPKVPGTAEPKWLPGIITHPEPFDLKIEPRTLRMRCLSALLRLSIPGTVMMRVLF